VRCTVNKDNHTKIGVFIRRVGRLAHERLRLSSVQELEGELGRLLEEIVENSLQSVLEIGCLQAGRDYRWWMLRDNAASSTQLEWFLATNVQQPERIRRLGAVQRTVELLSASRAVHTPWERLQSLVATSLTYQQEKLTAQAMPEPAVQPDFIMPLPPFVRSSSTLLSGLVDGPPARAWMMQLKTQSCARSVLLLQESALSLPATEDLRLAQEQLPVNTPFSIDSSSMEEIFDETKDSNAKLLDAKYIAYVGRFNKCSW